MGGEIPDSNHRLRHSSSDEKWCRKMRFGMWGVFLIMEGSVNREKSASHITKYQNIKVLIHRTVMSKETVERDIHGTF